MENLLGIIQNFKNKKIAVIGDIMLDEYILGNAERISAEEPILILDAHKVAFVPGGAANTANNISSLGGKVLLAGVIGPEDKGMILRKLLNERGVDITSVIIDKNRKTTVKTRAIAQNRQLFRIDLEDRHPIGPEIEKKVIDFIASKIKEINSIIISDYAKGFVTPNLAKNIIELADKNNIPCLIDPKGDDYSKYRGCSIITPNKKELAQFLNIPLDQLNGESRFIQAGKMLLSHVLSENVLITQGKEGMTLFKKTGEIFHCPAVNKNAIDVSGAGDTAIATFALSFTAGADIKVAMEIASYACGVSVGKMGTAIVTPEELKESLLKRTDYDGQKT